MEIRKLTESEGSSQASDDSDRVLGISTELEEDWGEGISFTLQLDTDTQDDTEIHQQRVAQTLNWYVRMKKKIGREKIILRCIFWLVLLYPPSPLLRQLEAQGQLQCSAPGVWTHIDAWCGGVEFVLGQDWGGRRGQARRGTLIQQDTAARQTVLPQISEREKNRERRQIERRYKQD